MPYKIHSTVAKLAHAQGFKVGGDYALYVLGVKEKHLPRMNHLRLYGSSLDIDKLIKTLDVLYGVEILQKDMKPFVQKIYFKLQGKIHVYYSNVQDSFMYSKDTIVLSGDGIEVMSPGSLNVLGARAMHTLEMTKRREVSLLQMVDGNVTLLPDMYVSSWDYITSQLDYIRAGWKIHPGDKWEIYVNEKKESEVPSNFECSICQNSLDDVFNEPAAWIRTGCGHTFHFECLKQWVVSGDYGWKCPMCRSSKLILYKNCVP